MPTALLATFPAQVLGQAVPSGCQATLGYLSSTIPETGNKKLDVLRQTVLTTDIRDVMRKISAQGLSISQALDLLANQAGVDGDALPSLEKNIRGAAQQPNDDLIAAIRGRNYGRVPITDDVLGVSIQAYIADDWGQLTNRETAKQIECFQSGPMSPLGSSEATANALPGESASTGISSNLPSRDEPWASPIRDLHIDASGVVDEEVPVYVKQEPAQHRARLTAYYWDKNDYVHFQIVAMPNNSFFQVLVDFNENSSMDAVVDRSYGVSADGEPCNQYFHDSNGGLSLCGQLKTGAHFSQSSETIGGKAMKFVNFWIPKGELSFDGKTARVAFCVYDETSEESYYYPSHTLKQTYLVKYTPVTATGNVQGASGTTVSATVAGGSNYSLPAQNEKGAVSRTNPTSGVRPQKTESANGPTLEETTKFITDHANVGKAVTFKIGLQSKPWRATVASVFTRYQITGCSFSSATRSMVAAGDYDGDLSFLASPLDGAFEAAIKTVGAYNAKSKGPPKGLLMFKPVASGVLDLRDIGLDIGFSGENIEVARWLELAPSAVTIEPLVYNLYGVYKGNAQGPIITGQRVSFLVSDDVQLLERIMKALEHAIVLCGGKPEPF